MPLKPLTYGTLPSEVEFREAFARICLPDGHFADEAEPPARFRFTNDSRVDTCELTCSELWREVNKALAEGNGFVWRGGKWADGGKSDDAAGQWCSEVLRVLGWEWI